MDCVRDWLAMKQVSSTLRSSVYDFFVLKYRSEKIFDEQELLNGEFCNSLHILQLQNEFDCGF